MKDVINSFKYILGFKFLRKPFWTILILGIFNLIHNFFTEIIDNFLYYIDGQKFEKYYGGKFSLTKLFLNLKDDGMLAFRVYISSELIIVAILILVFFCLFYFQDKVKEALAPGKSQDVYLKISNYLFNDRPYLNWAIGIALVYFIFSYLETFRLSLQWKVNDLIVKNINTFQSDKIDKEHSLYYRNPKSFENQMKCTFYLINAYPRYYKISRFDFFLYLVGVQKPGIVETFSKYLPSERSTLVFDQPLLDSEIIVPNKENFKRDEVISIVKDVKKNSFLRNEQNLSAINKKEPFLLVKYEAGHPTLEYKPSAETNLYLGRIDYKCSRNFDELITFHFSKLP